MDVIKDDTKVEYSLHIRQMVIDGTIIVVSRDKMNALNMAVQKAESS